MASINHQIPLSMGKDDSTGCVAKEGREAGRLGGGRGGEEGKCPSGDVTVCLDNISMCLLLVTAIAIQGYGMHAPRTTLSAGWTYTCAQSITGLLNLHRTIL